MIQLASPTYLEVCHEKEKPEARWYSVTVLCILTLTAVLCLPPHVEDLMSLLDADIHSAHPSVIIDADAMFSEDISYFGYPSFRRSSLSRLGSSRGNSITHV